MKLLRLFVTSRIPTHQPVARPYRQLCSTETHKHPAAEVAVRKAFVQLCRKHAPALALAVPLCAGPEPGKASSHKTGACVDSAHLLQIVLRPFLSALFYFGFGVTHTKNPRAPGSKWGPHLDQEVSEGAPPDRTQARFLVH